MPPIDELTRIEPVLLDRLEHQGIFTTGLLLEVSETPTRRQTLADQVKASPNDVLEWRDEALMLNLAGFGADEHQLLIQSRIEGLRDILALSVDEFRERLARGGDRPEGGPTERPDDPELVGPGAHARRGVGAGLVLSCRLDSRIPPQIGCLPRRSRWRCVGQRCSVPGWSRSRRPIRVRRATPQRRSSRRPATARWSR